MRDITLPPHRQRIELIPLMTSVGHEVIHQHPETEVVGRFQQMGHFVDQHVFQAFGRFFARSLNDKGYHAAGAQR